MLGVSALAYIFIIAWNRPWCIMNTWNWWESLLFTSFKILLLGFCIWSHCSWELHKSDNAHKKGKLPIFTVSCLQLPSDISSPWLKEDNKILVHFTKSSSSSLLMHFDWYYIALNIQLNRYVHKIISRIIRRLRYKVDIYG